MGNCVVCESSLRGRQTKYCSRKCKNDFGNNRFQSYMAQQRRGRSRKLELVRLKGNTCGRCGYGRNFSALEFHHRNPDSKKFQLDLRSLSNRSWAKILNEAQKCDLVCSNCHKEIHNPTSLMQRQKNRAMPDFSCCYGRNAACSATVAAQTQLLQS